MTDAIDIALYRTEQVRALDAHAIDHLGVPGYTLMQRAASAALDSLCRRWPGARHVVVMCGPGNNGGDGFLLAALARARGMQVQVLALGEESSGDAAAARAACSDAGVPIRVIGSPEDLPGADVYVDALFGTGLGRAPEGVAAHWIEAMNANPTPVLALDVPSGLEADSGAAMQPTVRADATVTFVAWKRGLFTHQAPDHVGDLTLDRLELPVATYEQQQADAELMQRAAWPARARCGHKGDYGHVLAIGGDHGMAGAIRLCGEAALRGGSGLVSVATRAEHRLALNAARPELMVHAVEALEDLQPLLERATVLALGPGLGQGDWGRVLWRALRDQSQPRVVDADGLNLLAQTPAPFEIAAVITPHPGEAARLLETDTASVQADRFAAARSLAERYNAVTVLKGCGTLVADPDGRVAVCPWGNPGMASGGMGDVLTGIVAAGLAQGLPAWDAACLGVQWHARAGDEAACCGERGLIASDVLERLRGVANGVAGD